MITKRTCCTAILVLAIIFKFWLIAEMEITDEGDDSLNYLAQILTGGPNFFGPGTGCLGRLLVMLGIPFRTGIEIAFLLSSFFVVRALFDWPVQSYLALGLFLFVTFNPAPEELFSHLMSDQVWLVEILFGISFFVLFVGTESGLRWLWLALAAVCLGFSAITRTTIIPLCASFLVWAIIFAVF